MIESICKDLEANPRRWVITGVAGFIGSNLLETLLKLNQTVVGIDNLSTGFISNLTAVKTLVTSEQWKRFTFHHGDLLDKDCCNLACNGADYVLHQAAFGSVPLSFADPCKVINNNITGFMNILMSAKEANVKSFVYASSSAVYGDCSILPQIEYRTGNPLSPYALAKKFTESISDIVPGIQPTGLRYFNVFGPRQNPDGDYAAVIPRWITRMIQGKQVVIFGDGTTSRDFCYIDNVVQMNILAAVVSEARGEVFNVAWGVTVTLTDLFLTIRDLVGDNSVLKFQPERYGDIKHSMANINKAINLLGYKPNVDLREGVSFTLDWMLHI